MKGVTILETLTINEINSAPALIVMGLMFVFIITSIILEHHDILAYIFCGLGVCCLISFFVILLAFPIKITEYRVLIDDSVKLNEFLQYYEIVRQEGLTYIVKPII